MSESRLGSAWLDNHQKASLVAEPWLQTCMGWFDPKKLLGERMISIGLV